jgi:Na+/H+ antiporter NhaD/arsenite permease-like protein
VEIGGQPIRVDLAGTRRVRLGFVEYLKAGIPITLLTLAWGVAWLSLRG